MSNKVQKALLKVTDKVYHYEATKQEEKYVVWAEDGEGDTVYADNTMQSQSIAGTIDYFTKQEYDENFERIQQALQESGIAFKLNSVQYEKDTEYIHFEWIWEVC